MRAFAGGGQLHSDSSRLWCIREYGLDYPVGQKTNAILKDGPDWEIGKIAAQLTWNVLVKQVPGGDTIIYDRQWQGDEDDKVFRKTFPRYAYHPTGVQGRIFKALPAVEGDLTFFNPRYDQSYLAHLRNC